MKEIMVHIAWTPPKSLNLGFLHSKHLNKCLMIASKASKTRVSYEIHDPMYLSCSCEVYVSIENKSAINQIRINWMICNGNNCYSLHYFGKLSGG